MLRAAVAVCDDGDPISGAVLAMLGSEELGRSQILRELADRVDNGASLEPHEVRKACENHRNKQLKGAFSTTLRAEPPSGVDRDLRELLDAAQRVLQFKCDEKMDWPHRASYGAEGYEKGDEDRPFFTEAFLYNALGKGNARTLLARGKRLEAAISRGKELLLPLL